MNERESNGTAIIRHENAKRGLAGGLLVLLFLIAAVLPLAVAALTAPSSSLFAIEFGAATAILATTLLLLQFLSSGRFETLSGRVGIDRTMGFHRIAAYVLLLLAVTHPLSYVGSALIDDPQAGLAHLAAMLGRPRLRSGVLALALLAILIAFASVRTKSFVRYEVWRAAHGPVAILIGGLALHHAMGVGSYSADQSLRIVWIFYALAVLASVLNTYLLRPWRMWREGWRLEAVKPAAEGVSELILRGSDATRLDHKGGQFIWLSIEPNRPPFHDHPFSIASSAGFLPRLRLLVRHAGDCTNTFRDIKPGTRIAMDGPHGSFCLPRDASAVAMVAGGVGIAPILGMLEEAAEQGDGRPFRLLYAARSEAALACRARLSELSHRLHLEITYCVDQNSSSPGMLQGPIGKHHLNSLLSGLPVGETAVLLCGPPAMMEMASDALLSLGVLMANVHYERFDYGAGHSRIDKHRRAIALMVLASLAASALLFGLR